LFELVPDDAVAAGYLRSAETQAAAAATSANVTRAELNGKTITNFPAVSDRR
jgi:hypothetical protein